MRLNYLIKLLIAGLLLYSTNSCVSVKKYTSDVKVEKINSDNLGKVIATYKNLPVNSPDYVQQMSSLWSIINYSSTKKYPNWKSQNVMISKKDDMLIAQLIENNLVLETKTLSGKIYDDYYFLRRQYKFQTFFFFLINGIGDSSVKITIRENNLFVVSKSEGLALIVVFPGFGSGGNVQTSEFEKVL